MTMDRPDDLGAPPPGDVASRLTQAIQGAGPDDVRIRLQVHGGQRTERYDFSFEVTRRGVAALELRDELAPQSLEGRQTRDLDPADVNELFTRLNVDELLAASDQTPLFPPDSLIGELILSVDGRDIRILFAADQEQAKTADIEPPPAVAQLVDAMYAMAERSTGGRGLRP